MKAKKSTKIAKNFFKEVSLEYVINTLNKINFTPIEKKIAFLLLQNKTIKELSIEFNLSLSHIAAKKQEIYRKIYIYLQENNHNN